MNGSRRSGNCIGAASSFSRLCRRCASPGLLSIGVEEGLQWRQRSLLPLCACDCPPPLSLQKVAPGLLNLSVPDCGKNDPELSKEMEKQFVDILAEELKLQEVVAQSRSRHMNYTILEARRLAAQYQKEAEKCNAATETCEEARERAEASLTREKVITSLWERRARLLGWQGR
ncbi:unnamed protein product [Spirodela intermedia]|uniref:Uncharacterized protein n=1 Tax=Spirodela intermedia TaxID=51605 RepID=A0A7I8IUF9_SPIIN|nr:unnamed protein product [Spirodela intermedia]CAA6661664.1 unnamed protein product [Spirodela intermedia]